MGILPKYILLVFLFEFFLQTCFAQQDRPPHLAARIYEDNDFMNIYGHGSDRRYTNGTRADIFYTRKKTRSLLYRLSLKTSDAGPVTYGWGIMQAMITPSNLKKTIFQPDDYPYSGGLYAIHSLHFSDFFRKINIQTDWIAGVMGPPSLARQTQLLIHQIGDYLQPRGWQYQLPTDILLNYNVELEKRVSGNSRTWEFIAASKLYAGSMLDGVSFSTQLRLGNLNPYFKGNLGQVFSETKKFTFSVSVMPGVDVILYNALLQGGLFNPDSPFRNKDENRSALHREIIQPRFDLQVMTAFHKLAVSFTQKTVGSDFRGMGGQNFGNVSLYVALK